jgi:hypothetical protein
MTYEELDAVVPENVKLAYLNHQVHKLAEERTGLTDFSFASISRYMGEKIAARRMRHAVIMDGLTALKMLRG